MRKGKAIAIAICAVCLFAVGIFFMTQPTATDDQSCLGISLYGFGEPDGAELIVRYFEHQSQAQDFFTDAEISSYYLLTTHEDSDTDSQAWFAALEAPLVDSNAKFVTLSDDLDANSSFLDFMAEQDLVPVDETQALDEQTVHEAELDTSLSLYPKQTAIDAPHEDYTQNEVAFVRIVDLLADVVEQQFDRLQLSIDQQDAFSIEYWCNELEKLALFQLSATPISRENIDYDQIAASVSDCLYKLQTVTQNTTITVGTVSSELRYLANALNAQMQSAPTQTVSVEIYADLYSLLLPRDWLTNTVWHQPSTGTCAFQLATDGIPSEYGGFLFSISLYAPDEAYDFLPAYQLLGTLSIAPDSDYAMYNGYHLIVQYPTDVQFTADEQDTYNALTQDIDGILASLIMTDEVLLLTE